MLLDPYRTDVHYRLRFFRRLIIHPQVANAEFPRRDWIGPHRFTVSGLDGWLMYQLFVYRIQDNGLLASSQRAQVIFGVGRVFDTIWQCLGSTSSVDDESYEKDACHYSTFESALPI